MKWKGRQSSSNVEDRRGQGRSSKGLVGGGIGTIVLFIIVALLGGNPMDVINNSQFIDSGSPSEYVESAEEGELADFSSVVLKETETVWSDLFEEQGWQYEYPKLVLYDGNVDSACGAADSSFGPFYCSGDNSVYIDLSFYDELKENFGASGDFAFAYVIAHEVGHHVQNQLGITDQVNKLRGQLSQTEFNEVSVRMELQADYFAGVWAHYVKRSDLLEAGDIEEALNAASAVGDDRIQQKSIGYVIPDKFTHGTSKQRMNWFNKGYQSGNIENGDTFNTNDL